VHVILIDGEDDDVFGENVDLQMGSVGDHKRSPATDLFRPPADLALFISVFQYLGKEETVEKVYLALSLLLCPLHEHGAIKVDDFVVEPLTRCQQKQLLLRDFIPVAIRAEMWILDLAIDLYECSVVATT
jgi:hypothetical protein